MEVERQENRRFRRYSIQDEERVFVIQATVQREILENAEISADGKTVAYYGLLAADSEREIMDALDK